MNPFKCVICESDVQDPGHIGESNCPNCNSVFSYDEGMTLIKCGNLYTDDDYRRLVDESAKRIKELEQERDQYKSRAKALAKICHDAASKARNMGWDEEDVYDE